MGCSSYAVSGSQLIISKGARKAKGESKSPHRKLIVLRISCAFGQAGSQFDSLPSSAIHFQAFSCH